MPGTPIEVRQTDAFARWLAALRDLRARVRIVTRIDRLTLGHFGDAKPVGGGISELRIHYGSGYRLYFARRGERIILLVCGGDKSSQQADIVRARDILAAEETSDGS